VAGIILITGGARGIGAATAKLAAARGHTVAINYQSRSDAAEALVTEITRAGGTAAAFQGDVSKEDDVVGLFDQVERDLGPLGALVNSVGRSDEIPPWTFGTAALMENLAARGLLGKGP